MLAKHYPRIHACCIDDVQYFCIITRACCEVIVYSPYTTVQLLSASFVVSISRKMDKMTESLMEFRSESKSRNDFFTYSCMLCILSASVKKGRTTIICSILHSNY